MMELHIQIFSFKMRVFMKVGITIHGQQEQNTKSIDTIDSKEKEKGLVNSKKFNSPELKPFKTMIRNTNAT